MDAGERLLEALREFVDGEAKPRDQPSAICPVDVAWVLAGVVAVGFVLALVPSTWKGSEATKSLIDHAGPWILNLTALGAILKSREAVVRWSQSHWFRVSVGGIVPALALVTVPFVRIDPLPVRTAEPRKILVDSEPDEKKGPFYLNVWNHDVELRSGTQSRVLHLDWWKLLTGVYSHPTWRQPYDFVVTVRSQEISMCVQPQGFTLDDDFLADARDDDTWRRVSATAVEAFSRDGGSVTMRLPAGQYQVIGVKAGCHTPPLLMDSSDVAASEHLLERERCTDQPLTNPCVSL